MKKKLPPWMADVDFTPKAPTSLGSNGEILVGGEIDELRRGDGLRPALIGKASLHTNRKLKIKSSSQRKKRGPLITVVPALMGQPSTSYMVHGGSIVAKGGRFWKKNIKGKKKKKKRGKQHSHSSTSVTSGPQSDSMPTNSKGAIQHLGKKDPFDASREWATSYRDRGSFGSFPIHDPHGDESAP